MKNLKSIIFYILLGILIAGTISIAGSLTPTEADILPTMVTLEDVYQKITNINSYALSDHDISTSIAPSNTMHTLSDIWYLLPESILANTILTGTTILGVEGSASIGEESLEWSTSQGSLTWNDAVATCNAINGRLPTVDELSVALTEQFINSNPFISGFVDNTLYWSVELDIDNAYCIGGYSGSIETESQVKTNEHLVRCVR